MRCSNSSFLAIAIFILLFAAGCAEDEKNTSAVDSDTNTETTMDTASEVVPNTVDTQTSVAEVVRGFDSDTTSQIPRPSASVAGCAIVVSNREQMQSDTYVSTYTLRTYDAVSRIVEERRYTSADFNEASTQPLYWRLDETGRLLTYAGKGNGEYENFRHDYTRDEHGNVTRFAFTYGAWDDLAAPANGSLHLYYEYMHIYDENGLLVESQFIDGNYGPMQHVSYTHDENGRCASMVYGGQNTDIPQRTDTIEYDDANRISRVRQNIQSSDGTSAVEVVVAHSYDGQGRPLATEQDGGGHWETTADGTPDILSYWTYSQDGGQLIERLDFTNDLPNEEIERNGQIVFVTRSFEARSAACTTVDNQVPTPSELECRFD
ncbi:MAG: hypothetical protein JXR76_21525 [Deltaproteobacteria bacterium]|nr:hypothetical protein [Deltaproteobacteria bacterium]